MLVRRGESLDYRDNPEIYFSVGAFYSGISFLRNQRKQIFQEFRNKDMIIYYTGTGNSRFIAEAAADFLADEVTDARPYIKTHKA